MANRRTWRGFCLLFCQGSFALVCLAIVFDGRNPPVHAQQVPEISVYRMNEIDKHLESTDKHVESTEAQMSRQWEAIQKNSIDIAGMQGEQRIIGSILALLSGVSIVIQVRKKTP